MKQIIQKLLMVMAMLFSFLTMSAFEVDGVKYRIVSSDDRTVSVEGPGYGCPAGLEIPERVMNGSLTYKVIAIDWKAFMSKYSLKSIKIPNSVTSIGQMAFYECSNLQSADLSNSLTSIGYKVFLGCESLKSVNIPNSVTSIGNSTFWGCRSLATINIPNSVTSIGNSAFSECESLTTINIPNSVTSIGESAFEGCKSLTTIDIPNSVTSIGDGAFSDCSSLSMINVDNNNSMYISVEGILYTKNNNSPECLHSCPGGKSGAIIIPNSVTSIGVGAFYCCEFLTTIDLPNSVTSIGASAFGWCESLTTIDIPNSVTSIGEYAFLGCKSLKSVNIPNSVTSISDWAFDYCVSLTTIDIPNTVTSIGDYAFCNCSNIENVYCYWYSPIEAGNELFERVVLKNAILHVPLGTKDKYEKVDPWRNFWNIVETDYSGIDAISDDSRNCKINVFDISGNLVMEGCHREDIEVLPKGIYILVSKDRTEKVVR